MRAHCGCSGLYRDAAKMRNQVLREIDASKQREEAKEEKETMVVWNTNKENDALNVSNEF